MIEAAATLAEYIELAERQAECRNYVSCSILFAISARWPLPAAERRRLYYEQRAIPGEYRPARLRKDWGTLPAPSQPPASLSDAQAETARRFLQRRGWTLVRSSTTGRWGLARLANF